MLVQVAYYINSDAANSITKGIPLEQFYYASIYFRVQMVLYHSRFAA